MPLWIGLHMCYNDYYNKMQKCKFKLIFKNNLSSDYSLQFKNMKLELLVIVYKYETVNLEPNLVHTARHAMEAGSILNI